MRVAAYIRRLSSYSTGPGSMAFWEKMWAGGLAPGQKFDANGVEPAFADLIAQKVLPHGKAFVPGCGRGYAVLELAKAGYSATGLDIAPTGVAAADELRKEQGIPDTSAKFVVDDFFTFAGGPYDLIYDCTFLCAIPEEKRNDWASSMNRLLKSDGELVTLIFPVASYQGGPPFAMSEKLVRSLLEPEGFSCVSLEAVPPEKVARHGPGKELIARWKLK